MADSAAAPRPQSASLDIDDGLSDAVESPRSDACINWPSRRRRRRAPRPAPTAVLVRLALGTVAAAAAGLGHASFKKSDLYGVADRSKWRTCAGYDARVAFTRRGDRPSRRRAVSAVVRSSRRPSDSKTSSCGRADSARTER